MQQSCPRQHIRLVPKLRVWECKSLGKLRFAAGVRCQARTSPTRPSCNRVAPASALPNPRFGNEVARVKRCQKKSACQCGRARHAHEHRAEHMKHSPTPLQPQKPALRSSSGRPFHPFATPRSPRTSSLPGAARRSARLRRRAVKSNFQGAAGIARALGDKPGASPDPAAMQRLGNAIFHDPTYSVTLALHPWIPDDGVTKPDSPSLCRDGPPIRLTELTDSHGR